MTTQQVVALFIICLFVIGLFAYAYWFGRQEGHIQGQINSDRAHQVTIEHLEEALELLRTDHEHLAVQAKRLRDENAQLEQHHNPGLLFDSAPGAGHSRPAVQASTQILISEGSEHAPGQALSDATLASLRDTRSIDAQEIKSLCCEAAGIIQPLSSPAKALIPHDKLREAAPADATLIAKNRPHAQPAKGYTHPSVVGCIVAAMESTLAEQAGTYATSEQIAQAIEAALQRAGFLLRTEDAYQTLHARLAEPEKQREHHRTVANLKRTITELEERIMSYTGMPVTRSDYDLLLSAAETLRLAEKTWKAIPGTEPGRNRAAQQQQDIQALAVRIHFQLRSTPAIAATAGEAA